ncbi:hypothetical protein PR048_002473 [Dryococelus australis]|uniref:Uncharacterized protein n=1 Tax=Dryococelus australis TaxID=614101 RepID=A0ABQ9IL11_9NEOP|nr:hypothetical protein PR048_002473 [Dryococelus australis]
MTNEKRRWRPPCKCKQRCLSFRSHDRNDRVGSPESNMAAEPLRHCPEPLTWSLHYVNRPRYPAGPLYGLSHVGIVLDDDAVLRIFLGDLPFLPVHSFKRCSILASLHPHRLSRHQFVGEDENASFRTPTGTDSGRGEGGRFTTRRIVHDTTNSSRKHVAHPAANVQLHISRRGSPQGQWTTEPKFSGCSVSILGSAGIVANNVGVKSDGSMTKPVDNLVPQKRQPHSTQIDGKKRGGGMKTQKG